MRKIFLSFLLTALLFCGSVIFVSAATPTGSDTLRVGVRANVSGFGYVNADTGRYSGLEVDIADEMASRLGYSETEFKTATPDTSEKLLLDDDVDCVLACYSITDEREETLDFSPAYYTDRAVVLLEDSSLFTNIFDMKGCNFGMVKGSDTVSNLISKLTDIGFTNGEIVDSNIDGSVLTFDNFSITEMKTYTELDQALEAGTIDAMCTDSCIIKTYLFPDRNIMKNFQIGEENYAVATAKDSDLSEPAAETIQEMLDDGTIAALIDKWD